MAFSYSDFVKDARAAATSEHPTKAVRALLEETIKNPELAAEKFREGGEDEEQLFEDDTVSIWSCWFRPEFVMPPHEHKMDVHIGVVSGGEKNIMFRREGNSLKHVSTKVVNPGEVLSLGADGIHAVTADGGKPSHALHVYLGPLMQVKRDLFDWQSGEPVDFTMENFEAMKRRPTELPSY